MSERTRKGFRNREDPPADSDARRRFPIHAKIEEE